jgi:hypothetical protein
MARKTEARANNLEHIDIPGTSLKPSRIALGTWAIGGWMWGGTDEAEAIRTIHEAVDRGIGRRPRVRRIRRLLALQYPW